MPTTPLGIRYPFTTATVNVPGDLNNLASDADSLLSLLVNPPRFKVYQDFAQSFANNTFVSVQFNQEEFDSANGHDNVTNNTRYTVQPGHGGLWLLSGKMSWATNTTNRRQNRWFINGATVVLGSELSTAPATTAPQPTSATMIIPLSAGDYIEMQVGQDSGGSLSTGLFGASTYPWMAGVRLSS